MTYKDVVAQYLGYVKNKFGQSNINFDGYNADPSIKDHEHQTQAARTLVNIQIDDAWQVAVHQEAFRSNERNKDQFEKMLHNSLETDGHSIIQSHGDADTNIVSEALQLAIQGNSVTVAANNRDILVMLLFHFSNDMANISLLLESKQLCRMLKKQISIQELAEKTNHAVLQNLLLIHAWDGCDSTSAVYRHRKCAIIKII